MMKNFLRQISSLMRLSFLELYRRKDIVVVVILGMAILLPLTFFKPFGVEGAGRYRNEIAMMLIWVFTFAIAIGMSARLFPPEFTSRTIYPLLSKPVSRTTVLIGKFLGAWLASCSALLIFYAIYTMLARNPMNVLLPPALLQGFFMHTVFLALVVAVGMAGSLVMTPSANITLNSIVLIAMFIFGEKLPQYADRLTASGRGIVSALYWVCPHAEFFDMRQRIVHGWPGVPGDVFIAVLAYAAVYSALAIAAASLAFRRRKL